MVNLLFILHIITAVVLVLVTATYLVEFSYRHQNYTKLDKLYKNVDDSLDGGYKYRQKYKNLRIGKPVDGANPEGCFKWGLKKCKSLNGVNEQECRLAYVIDNGAYDPILHEYLFVVEGNFENGYKNAFCTNEWYKWNASRFIPAILSLFFAIVEILFALEKVDIIKGLTYGFWVRIILFVAFGLDVLGVSGDLGFSTGIILLVLTLVWVIFFFVGFIDKSKIGAN
uniref:Uncharacterized protein n=1 Tax=Coptotermes formosanus TaxID=36987 RepID=R4V312_COPFO|nr:hypothetical protein [Coptotermes formosanus]